MNETNEAACTDDSRMEVSLGKITGDAKNISIYFALEFPLDDKTDQYSGKLGLTYFFD